MKRSNQKIVEEFLHYTSDDRYTRYEIIKERIQHLGLPSDDYEEAMKYLVEKLGI